MRYLFIGGSLDGEYKKSDSVLETCIARGDLFNHVERVEIPIIRAERTPIPFEQRLEHYRVERLMVSPDESRRIPGTTIYLFVANHMPIRQAIERIIENYKPNS